jgi:hypothetical protein
MEIVHFNRKALACEWEKERKKENGKTGQNVCACKALIQQDNVLLMSLVVDVVQTDKKEGEGSG